ncbi:MAG: hypothetical protein QW448_08940 [Thermofilaceae archaeon]
MELERRGVHRVGDGLTARNPKRGGCREGMTSMGNQSGSRVAPLAVENNAGAATRERNLDREDAAHPAAAPRSGAVMPDRGFDRAPRSIENLAALTCSSTGARRFDGFSGVS